MTPSQKKTVLFLERLLKFEDPSAQVTPFDKAQGNLRCELSIYSQRVGVAKITPIGRPYWEDEE